MERLLFEFAIRVSLIAVMTGVVLRILRIRSAAAQHAAWVGVTLAMLLLPAWMAWGPKASLPVLPAQPSAVVDLAPMPSFEAEFAPPMEAAPAPQSHWNWPAVLFGVYLLGALALLLRLAIGTVRTRRLTSASCSAPVTVGLFRPRIILPESAREWTQSQLNAVMTHEREHARRRDPLFQWLALFNRALCWFHPLSWWLELRLAALAEEACDTAVLESGHDPREYSMCLLDMAREVQQAGTRVNVVAVAMPGVYLPQRIKRIVAGVRAPRVSRARLACAAVVCSIPAALFAAGSLERAPQLLPLWPLPARPVPQPPPLLAQAARSPTPAPPAPASRIEFEAASVKPVAPVSPWPYVPGILRGGPGTADPGRITYSGVGLRGLLTLAYGLQRYQVIGPDWLDGERFDITATIRPGATKEEVNAMLRNLLSERFHVSLHHESREMPVYELTVGKGGPKLRASLEHPSPPPVTPEPLRSVKNGLPELAPGRPSIFMTMRGTVVHLTASTQTLAALAGFLTNSQLRALQVVDKTGLMGTYDFVLDFAPEPTPSPDGIPGSPGAQMGAAPPPQADAPSIYVAVQEQLGLRLEQKKGPVEVLVVDYADKVPVEN